MRVLLVVNHSNSIENQSDVYAEVVTRNITPWNHTCSHNETSGFDWGRMNKILTVLIINTELEIRQWKGSRVLHYASPSVRILCKNQRNERFKYIGSQILSLWDIKCRFIPLWCLLYETLPLFLSITNLFRRPKPARLCFNWQCM